MLDPAIDPVLCSPYDPPDRHCQLDGAGRADRTRPPLHSRREPVRISVPDDTKTARQRALKLDDRKSNRTVMAIREEVARWREAGYQRATPTSRRLLWHWTDPQSMKLRPFFAQVEAIETFIWLREVVTRANPHRRELEHEARKHNDGIVRLCAKMATGTGKTAVMGMLIAWQTLNAVRSRRTQNVMHTDRFAVFAPGHTVRERLGVLIPSNEQNVYDEMDLVPQDMRTLLNRARVRVVNYQAFTRKELIDDPQARKLLGRAKGTDAEAPSAAVRRVLRDIADGRGRICVINDESHHCYLPTDSPRRRTGEDKAEDERAAVWFNTIRAMRDEGLLGRVNEHGQECPVYDFSATPLWIDQSHKSEPEQFQWVSSDFGLMDAIESGLVKVPRVPVDDDSTHDETTWRKLYHNTNPKNLADYLASSDGSGNGGGGGFPEPLHGAIQAVVGDWERKLRLWQGHSPGGDEPDRPPQPTPPVIIFVANNIKNATTLWQYLSGRVHDDGTFTPGAFPELSNLDEHGRWHREPRTLLVHSKIGGADVIPEPLKKVLVNRAGLGSRAEAEEVVREMLNTVGKPNRPAAQVRCVVSVSMLTEGWDARTVTHIVGFRAFSTQLLCEQVTGRALRRTSYDAFRDAPGAGGRRLLEAEYADVVGVPFEFMPNMNERDPRPRPPKPRTRVHTMERRQDWRVGWPQAVEYIRTAPQGHFSLQPQRVRKWSPRPSSTPTMVLNQGVVGEAEIISPVRHDLRDRTALLKVAEALVGEVGGERARYGRTSLFRSAIKAVRQWASHPNVNLADLRVLLADPNKLQAAKEQILDACEFGEEPSGRRARLTRPPLHDTAGIDFETTLLHVLAEPQKSELSHAACHSMLEYETARALDGNSRVVRWVRNFQLGWTIPYWRQGAWARYEPDFVAVLDNHTNLIIECKGAWDDKSTLAAEYTRDHWIPSIAGTPTCPTTSAPGITR